MKKTTVMAILCLVTVTSVFAQVDVYGYFEPQYTGIYLDKKYYQFHYNKLRVDLKSTVVDNVEIPLLYRRLSSSERRRQALRALEKVGLSARVRHFPGQLSGGQCQRVAIARAIVGKPSLILADEPTGNLDSLMSDEILDILFHLNREEETTIVMVTHSPSYAEKASRVVHLFDGYIITENIKV